MSTIEHIAKFANVSITPLNESTTLQSLGIVEGRVFDLAYIINAAKRIQIIPDEVWNWYTIGDVVKSVNAAKPADVTPRKVINQIDREDIEDFRILYNTQAAKFNTLSLYQSIATKSAIYPGQGTPLGLAYVALALNGEAGEFAEHMKKAMRDDAFAEVNMFGDYDHPLSDERRNLLIKEIGDVLWYLSAACNELGISLSEAALLNLEKLCDRTERNALRGSGDER